MFCAFSALLTVIFLLFVFSALFLNYYSIATIEGYLNIGQIQNIKAIELCDTHMRYFSVVAKFM